MPRFTPYPIPQVQRPDFNTEVAQPVLQGINAFSQLQDQEQDRARQKQLMDIMKAKEARDQAQFDYDYGKPGVPQTESGFDQADPRLNLYSPTMQGYQRGPLGTPQTQYGNIMAGGQPEDMAPRAGGGIVEMFRNWQQSRQNAAAGQDFSKDLTDQQLFDPSIGAKRREDYLKNRKSRLEEQNLDRQTRKTEAEIELDKARAGYYGRSPGAGRGRSTLSGVTYANLVAQRNQLLRQKEMAIPGSSEESDAQGQIEDIDQELLTRRGKSPASGDGGDGAGGTPKPVLRPRPGKGTGGPSLPPQALSAVRQAGGRSVTFRNGQIWKWTNNGPVQVQ